MRAFLGARTRSFGLRVSNKTGSGALRGDGETASSRWPIGRNRTTAAGSIGQAERRSLAKIRPPDPDRHRVRAALWHAMGVGSALDRLQLEHDLLAALTRLAEGRGVGPPLAGVARSARPPEWHRLQLHLPRQRFYPGKIAGPAIGPHPTDRCKPGTKRHVVTDAKGIALLLKPTEPNVHDSRMLQAVVDAVRRIRQSWSRPRKRPSKLHADKAYDHRRCRHALTCRRNKHCIARRGIESSQRLGRRRWVVDPSTSSG